MDKKLKLVYRISIWIFFILLSSNALVKTTIWSSSSLEPKEKIAETIWFFRGTAREKIKYTTELKQKVFNKVDYLFAPAFIIFFALVAVKLVKTPGIFQEQEKK